MLEEIATSSAEVMEDADKQKYQTFWNEKALAKISAIQS